MAVWRPFTLLLLWIPGCLSLSCPSSVNGTIGGSLSVQCTYEKKDTGKDKYWCGFLCVKWINVIAKTSSTEREVTKDRVTIRDDPANLTFTVTIEHLKAADAGKYACGISQSLLEFDSKAWVKVTVFPAPKTTPLATVTNTLATVTKTETSSWTTQSTSMLPPTLATTNVSQSTHGQNEPSAGNDDNNLLVLMSVLTLLLLLLGVTSLLAWRMIRRQVRAIKNPVPVRDSCQAVERNELEPCYANLELETLRPPGGRPEPLGQLEVEYSTVAAPREELHYSTVMFSPQDQDSQTNGGPHHQSMEPEYSVVQRQRKT